MNKKILLVEDELFVRELYERVLKHAGYTVLTAADGQAGLELVQTEVKSSQKPDLILLDIMMPRLNGIELLKKLKADSSTKDIMVILLTNLGQESIIKEAFKIGAQGYMMKIRLSPYEIVARVKEFLDNPPSKIDVSQLDLE